MIVKKVVRVFKEQGAVALCAKTLNRIKYKSRSAEYVEETSVGEQALERQAAALYPNKVLISIVVPLFNTKPEHLRQMIDSVMNQSYRFWELCLTDAGKKSLEDVVNEYNDRRIKYTRLDKNYGISENTNKAVEMADGEYIGLLDHDDVLAPNALFEYRKRIDKGADFIYCDEASFTEDTAEPEIIHFKPDFSPYNLRGNNYICHFSVFKKSLFDEVGGLRDGFEGSQDHDLILRLTEKAENIAHIRKILYFWRIHKNSVAMDISAKPYCITSGVLAVSYQLFRLKTEGRVESIGGGAACYRCHYKVRGKGSCRSIKICSNRPLTGSEAEFIAVIPEGVKLFKKDICRLISFAAQSDVAAAGGIGTSLGRVSCGAVRFAGDGCIETVFDGEIVKSGGYMHRLQYAQNVNALNAFAVIKRSDFDEVGGFDETLPENERLMDLCIRLRENGKQIILDPEVMTKYKATELDLSPAFTQKHQARLATEDEYITNALADYIV